MPWEFPDGTPYRGARHRIKDVWYTGKTRTSSSRRLVYIEPKKTRSKKLDVPRKPKRGLTADEARYKTEWD